MGSIGLYGGMLGVHTGGGRFHGGVLGYMVEYWVTWQRMLGYMVESVVGGVGLYGGECCVTWEC